MNDHETADLVRESRIDPERFSDLYERVAPAVLTWARLRIRGRVVRHLGPEDLVQETWLRAFHSFDSYDEEKASFRAWIFTISTRLLLSATRNANVRRLSDGTPSVVEGLSDRATRVSQRLLREEALDELYRAIAEFSDEDRMLVVYCGLEGLATTEAATALGISKEAARKRWQRLREKLRGMARSDVVLH